jgi:hypothetical protein
MPFSVDKDGSNR